MPGDPVQDALPHAPHYELPAPTSADSRSTLHHAYYSFPYFSLLIVEFADIPLIDLSRAFTSDGQADPSTTKQLVDAMRNVGFCYIVNHGYSPDKVRSSLPSNHVLNK